MAGTDFNGLVGNRVWSPVVVQGFNNTQPAVVYHPDAEVPEAPGNLIANSIIFKCYGGAASFTASRLVAQRLYELLHGARAQTVTGAIMMARCRNMYQGGNDPDTGWPFHVAQYEILTQ